MLVSCDNCTQKLNKTANSLANYHKANPVNPVLSLGRNQMQQKCIQTNIIFNRGKTGEYRHPGFEINFFLSTGQFDF